MHFSTSLPGLSHFPPSAFAEPGNWQEALGMQDFQLIARTAERAGFDAMHVPEHIVMPREMAPNMGGYWCEAMTAMAFVAGATERMAVNSGVMVLPYHHPVVLAKALATLDLLSGGRVIVSFGAGMAPGEFAALGVPFEKRGRITDEYLQVLKLLWTEEAPEFKGEFIEFKDVVFEPKPLQRPHPRIIIGGRSIFALRRAARFGDGWWPTGAVGGNGPWLMGLEDLPRFLDEARRIEGFAEKEDRFEIHIPPISPVIDADHNPVKSGVRVSSTQQVIDMIATLETAGVTGTSVPARDPAPRSLAEHLEYLQWAGAEIIPHFHPKA
jgi:probable F420-dependent oxidoreductase